MATDYSSLKVPELKKLLQERSLPATGNKLDLVNRLKENDKASASAPAAEEDEIDYSDDEPAAPAKAAEASKPAEEAAPAAEPVPAPAPAAEPAAPATTEAAPEAAPAAAETTTEEKPEEAAAPKENFALNLGATDASEEARKRAERAKRFGIVEEDDDDAKKKAERAKRFGADADAANTSALDSALPERRPKRGRPERSDEQPGRDSKRQSTDGRGRRGGRGNRHGRQGGGRQGGGGGGVEKRSAAIDPADKARMEARAKRFAA
ncbi:sap domain-containing protein [Colletotrichum kahawae]|uniref:Sap domain-containing protein n=1 Tax=Colletotrichum kahawae TaxID=34407 RepID=A0AAE0D168_COLKA|nr:sap domain-containing protein [Colletotrichum kahawae]